MVRDGDLSLRYRRQKGAERKGQKDAANENEHLHSSRPSWCTSILCRPQKRKIRCKYAVLLTLLVFPLAVVLTDLEFQQQGFRTQPLASKWSITRGVVPSSRFFPSPGTPEFTQKCSWTIVPITHPNCTIYSHPNKEGGQGLAEWVSNTVAGHLYAQQAGCRLVVDYGKDVDIHRILTMPVGPVMGLNHEQAVYNNWTVPYGFHCSSENRCITVSEIIAEGAGLKERLSSKQTLGSQLARVPYYRHILSQGNLSQRAYKYRELEEVLSGFHVETGLACSVASLFQFNKPTVVEFEPNLFTNLLPRLQMDNTLVVAIYIRTGQADAYGVGRVSPQFESVHSTLQCATSLEEQYLKERPGTLQTIWMVLTDMQNLKQEIITNYTLPQQKVSLDHGKATKSHHRVVPRTVLTTGSRGAHTRTNRNPSTADFAEAWIDWYLMGESDLVVASNPGFSYGATASLRTSRPFYNGNTCTRVA